jgi:hypothetical protein
MEHAILDAESRRNAASTSDSEQPRRASPWRTRGLLTTTRRGEQALPIDEFGDVSIDCDQRERSESPRFEQGSIDAVRRRSIDDVRRGSLDDLLRGSIEEVLFGSIEHVSLVSADVGIFIA